MLPIELAPMDYVDTARFLPFPSVLVSSFKVKFKWLKKIKKKSNYKLYA